MILEQRYADAFLSFTKETIGLDKALVELKAAAHLLRDNSDFKHFLEAPDITNTEKAEVIDAVMSADFSVEMRSFFKLLIKKHRFGSFKDIAEYSRLAYSHGAELDAVVKVSYPLEIRTLQRIRTDIEKMVNRKIHMYVELDPTLLGGIYAKIGNIVIDGSVRKRLEDLRDKLLVLKVV